MKNNFSSVLRIRQFFLFVIGQTVSQLGDKLDHMALIALVGAGVAGASSHSSGLAYAQLAIFFTLPIILFGPIAGIMIDRWNKKRTLMVCDFLRAILVALIPIAFVKTNTVYSVYSIVFFVFLLGLFFNTAKMAVIPNLVARRKLLIANSLNAMIGRIATVVGMVFGGVIVGLYFWERFGWKGWQVGFYLDSFTYLISVATLSFIVERRVNSNEQNNSVKEKKDEDRREEKDREVLSLYRRFLHGFIEDIKEVKKLLSLNKIILFVLISILLVAFIGGAVYVLVIVIVQSMNWGTKGVGLLGGVLAIGMITGAFFLGIIGARLEKKQIILVGYMAIGFLTIIFSRSETFLLMIPTTFVSGMILSSITISQDTLLHELVPQEIRGRIFSMREIILNGSFILSAFVIGICTDWLMPVLRVRDAYRMTLLLIGFIIFIFALLGELWVRKILVVKHIEK